MAWVWQQWRYKLTIKKNKQKKNAGFCGAVLQSSTLKQVRYYLKQGLVFTVTLIVCRTLVNIAFSLKFFLLLNLMIKEKNRNI